MTRNIGEPCMCGDPACWVCGDGTPDAAPPPFDATIVPPASLADAYAAVVAQRDAALARAESAERDWQDAEDRAAVAETLRARVDALTAERDTGIRMWRKNSDAWKARVVAATVALVGLIDGIKRQHPEKGNSPWWYTSGFDGGACDLCLAGAWGGPESVVHAIDCPVPSAVAAYDADTAPATTAATAGEATQDALALYVVCDGLPGPDGCAFVELEDGDGRGHGVDVGVDWTEHPTAPGLYRLGPFVAMAVQS